LPEHNHASIIKFLINSTHYILALLLLSSHKKGGAFMVRKAGPQGLISERDLNEEIAKVAFDLYQQRGMKDGYDFDDWMKAEAIVRKRHARLKEKEIDAMSAVASEVAQKGRARRQAKQSKRI
jgi:hypothetical protein